MFLKKSAVLLILISAGAIGLLMLSVSGKPQSSLTPVKYVPSNPSNKIPERDTFSTWDMISEIMLRSAA